MHPRGHGQARDSHHAGECHLRQLQVPLRLARAAGHGYLPRQDRPDARLDDHRGREPLHLAMGLRLPPRLPEDCRDTRPPARRACPRADGHRHARTWHTSSAARRTRRASCCTSWAASPAAPSSTCATAAAPRRWPNGWQAKASPPITTTPGWTMPPRTCANTAGNGARAASSWRRTPSAWASTSRTCAWWCTWTCPTPSKPISRKRGVRGATGRRHTPSSSTEGRTRGR